MSDLTPESDIKSELKYHFETCNPKLYGLNSMCMKYKDQSKLVLGLYYFDQMNIYGYAISPDPTDRTQEAFAIFQSLSQTLPETIETYYAWTMMGRCYVTGIGIAENTLEAIIWFEKAADKGLASAIQELLRIYSHTQRFNDVIRIYELAHKFGFLGAAEALFELYADNPLVKNLNKASDWLAMVDNVNLTSPWLVRRILLGGEFEWRTQHHQYWLALNPKSNFKNQVFTLLLISKCRSVSKFRFTSLLVKNVSLCIIKHLARASFIDLNT